MGTKTAVSFANIFMAHIETTILSESFLSLQFGNAALTISFPYGTSVNQTSKPSSTKRTYIKHHPTIKFTAEISDTETVFLDTVVYKGKSFKEKAILDVKTHFKKRKPSSTHISPLVTRRVLKKDLSKEKPWMLRTNSPKTTFEENISNFKKRLIDRG